MTAKRTDWNQWTLTSLVYQWLYGQRPDYGIAVTTTSTSETQYVTLASSDTADATKVPYLIVDIDADVTAPTLTMTSPTSGQSGSGAVSVGLSVSDGSGGSGVGRLEVYVDDSLVGLSDGVPISGPITLSNIAGLQPGSHTVEARGYDRAGNQSSQTRTFTFTGIPVPTGLAALGVMNGKVQVSWHPVLGDSYSYNLYRSTLPDFTADATTRIQAGLTSPSFLDAPAPSSTPYYYRVTTVAPGGCGKRGRQFSGCHYWH